MTVDSNHVALAHDAMAEEYDQCDDLWYPWLFAQIHEFIAQKLPDITNRRPVALDVGCGTGLQSFLLARAGYDVTAFDLADKLLESAKDKIRVHAMLPMNAPSLFTSESWKGIKKHNQRMAKLLERKRFGRDVKPPIFIHADVNDFDFGEKRYDVIVCCGSVLSFLDDYDAIVRRMANALNNKGLIFLEIEQKRNMDLLWPIIDNLIGGKLGFEQSWADVWENLFSPRGKSIKIDYPFELVNGDKVVLPMWLFSVNEMAKIFKRQNLTVTKRLGIHWATSLLFPSTFLHSGSHSGIIKLFFNALSRVDIQLGSFWPMWRLGCSVIYLLKKS